MLTLRKSPRVWLQVFVVDLTSVAASPTLNAAAMRVFLSPNVVKLGYGFANDLAMLHSSFPEVLQHMPPNPRRACTLPPTLDVELVCFD